MAASREWLEPLLPGALGSFPYYWQDPSNLLFNYKTYNWIGASLRANSAVVQQDSGFFTNVYASVLSAINYELSRQDSASLERASQACFSEQRKMLAAWADFYGAVPKPVAQKQPIDIVFDTIATSWASPPISLLQLQSADLGKTLNKAPAGAGGVVQALAEYLHQIESTVPLQDAASCNRGRLAQAAQAVAFPAADNGGINLNDGTVGPAYEIRPSVEEIESGLDAPGAGLATYIEADRRPDGQYSVKIDGGKPTVLSSLKTLAIMPSHPQFEVEELARTSAGHIEIKLVAEGLTLVRFGPVAYDQATGENWYWAQPIVEAIANGSRDVTGFKFAPDPAVDFSRRGPFGFLTEVGLTKHPSVEIVSNQADAAALQRMSRGAENVSLNVGGETPAEESAPTHALEVTIDGAAQEDPGAQRVTVRFVPLPDARNVDSTAFVAGVRTCYPAA